jgi:hypothetical protein
MTTDEAVKMCEICGKPTPARACGGFDDHCSSECKIESMSRYMLPSPDRPARVGEPACELCGRPVAFWKDPPKRCHRCIFGS